MNSKDDIILGTCFVPPENSSKPRGFPRDTTRDNRQFCDYPCITLLGDVNVKTRELDLFIPDSERVPHKDVSVCTNLAFTGLLFQDSIINLVLKSHISKPNNYDFKLIAKVHLFKSFNIERYRLIGKTRCWEDKNIGKVTCQNKIIVDHTLLNIAALSNFSTCFYTNYFSILLSVVHCALTLSLTYKHGKRSTNVIEIPPDSVTDPSTTNKKFSRPNRKRPKPWSNDNATKYVQCINTEKLDCIDNLLIEFSSINNNNDKMFE